MMIIEEVGTLIMWLAVFIAEKASLPFLPTMFFSTVIVRTIWTTTS